LRKQKNAFAFLRANRALRESFLDELTQILANSSLDIYATTIRKLELTAKYKDPWNPYAISLHICMENLLNFLMRAKQVGKTVHVQFESRGAAEDKQLELEFGRICDNIARWGYKKLDFSAIQFEPRFVSKKSNSLGLQLADMFARPIGIHVLKPEQPNRAFNVIQTKLKNNKILP
jgi:hypothetical protein